MPELLQMKMKRAPVALICSASNSPPVPEYAKLLVWLIVRFRKLTVCSTLVSARTIGSRDSRMELAAARLKPAAVALLIKLRRENFLSR